MLQPHFFLIQVSLQFFSGTLQKSFEIFTKPGGCWVPDCRSVASGSISLPRLWVFGLPGELLESLVPKQAAALGAELRLKQDPPIFLGRLSWWQASNEPRDHLVEAFEDLDSTCKNWGESPCSIHVSTVYNHHTLKIATQMGRLWKTRWKKRWETAGIGGTTPEIDHRWSRQGPSRKRRRPSAGSFGSTEAFRWS